MDRAGVTGLDLPLRAADGTTVVVEAAEVALTFDGPHLARLAIEFAVPFAVYRTIEQGQLFHLEPEARDQEFAGFDPARPVELELELASARVAELAGGGIDGAGLAAATLLGLAGRADAAEPLLAAETWYAIRVKQDRGGWKSGYQTRWARAPRLG
ncbi:MAG TPA: hypothetical protein VL172_15025 [Kofleriaceae bacterium]|nr:hypothetical protein [Kofleriaceae bacterium]